jgi:hypothetical protein
MEDNKIFDIDLLAEFRSHLQQRAGYIQSCYEDIVNDGGDEDATHELATDEFQTIVDRICVKFDFDNDAYICEYSDSPFDYIEEDAMQEIYDIMFDLI